MKSMGNKGAGRSEGTGGTGFCRFRTDPRTGKVYDAWDYGHKAWPIRRNPGKRH